MDLNCRFIRVPLLSVPVSQPTTYNLWADRNLSFSITIFSLIKIYWKHLYTHIYTYKPRSICVAAPACKQLFSTNKWSLNKVINTVITKCLEIWHVNNNQIHCIFHTMHAHTCNKRQLLKEETKHSRGWYTDKIVALLRFNFHNCSTVFLEITQNAARVVYQRK